MWARLCGKAATKVSVAVNVSLPGSGYRAKTLYTHKKPKTLAVFAEAIQFASCFLPYKKPLKLCDKSTAFPASLVNC